MGTFSDPIIGGGEGKLIRAAIESPNYVTGVSGWHLDRDGSAEFQNATVRGTITGSTIIAGTPGGERIELGPAGEIKIYDAANNLVAILDEFGLWALGLDGSYIRIWIPGGTNVQISMNPPPNGAQTYLPGAVYARSSTLATKQPFLWLESPMLSGGGAVAYLTLEGEGIGQTTQGRIACDEFGFVPVQNATTVVTITGDLWVTGQAYIDKKVCRAASSLSTPLTSSNWTALPLDDEKRDPGGWHSNVTNNSRITPDVHCWAEVYGVAVFAGSSLGPRRGACVRKNGTTLWPGSAQLLDKGTTSSNLAVASVPIIIEFNGTTDYIELMAYTEGGAGQTTTNSPPMETSLTLKVEELLP